MSFQTMKIEILLRTERANGWDSTHQAGLAFKQTVL